MTAEPRFDDKGRWLSLGGACRLLEVSQTALRQWADGGRLRVYRTPGGHRRFLLDDVLAFTAGEGSAGAAGTTGASGSRRAGRREALEGSALKRIRRRLHRQAPANQPWRQSMDAEGRLRMRLFGRRVLTLLAEEPATRPRRQEGMTEAYLLGRQYGWEMAEKSVTLKDTVEAFIFFRSTVLDAADPASWSRILDLADRVLVGMTAAYEERLSGAAGPAEPLETPPVSGGTVS